MAQLFSLGGFSILELICDEQHKLSVASELPFGSLIYLPSEPPQPTLTPAQQVAPFVLLFDFWFCLHRFYFSYEPSA